ncbi:MAG TPA: hypothetical protein VH105_20905 [Burkholderiales bacterium]|nr:hypothetical protein [Burkholderiales bacterium]
MKIQHLFVLAACLASSLAFAQPAQRIRGTITGLEGDTLSFKSREGQEMKVTLAPNVSIGAAKKIALADIKPGSFVGTSAVKGKDGMLTAREVHVLPPNTNPGHRPWDLEPGSTMTNGNISSTMQSVEGRVLTVEYEGGMQKVLVPENVPVVAGIPATRADLVPGAYAILTVTAPDGGKITAQRVQVTKDGVRPPQ